MASEPAIDQPMATSVDAQLGRIASIGATGHPHLSRLATIQSADLARDIADMVHLLCSLYGRYPGLLEIALGNCPAGPVRDWMVEASDAFERERLYLVRLTSSVGPLPSTPGSAETEAVLATQRHAIETLARSERRGCALGAATALVGDWPSIRSVLDRAADRAGLAMPAMIIPDSLSIAKVIAVGCDGMASERALAFGSEQLLLQNRGLLDLLEARSDARQNL